MFQNKEDNKQLAFGLRNAAAFISTYSGDLPHMEPLTISGRIVEKSNRELFEAQLRKVCAILAGDKPEDVIIDLNHTRFSPWVHVWRTFNGVILRFSFQFIGSNVNQNRERVTNAIREAAITGTLPSDITPAYVPGEKVDALPDNSGEGWTAPAAETCYEMLTGEKPRQHYDGVNDSDSPNAD